MEIHFALLGSAFLSGIAGSLHCAGMCGPLAGTLSILIPDKSKNTSLQLAYNSGRLVSYSIIGLLLGLLGEGTNLVFSKLLPIQEIAAWMGILVLLFLGVGLVFGKFAISNSYLTRLMGKVTKPILGDLKNNSLSSKKTISLGFVFGFLTGFLPCGILYPAFATAFASGSPFLGSAIMAFFFLGTFPLLFLFGIGFRSILTKVRGQFIRYAGGAIVIVSIFMILLRFQHNHEGHSTFTKETGEDIHCHSH
ncbi:membrane protein [Leptospira kobayashii]|uniref:Membrane protein n=1 Tax=Leptospira kobayashii TaxID=1917830 RepID=A0ABN6KGJ0_9LEPT|nr:sulfite exporter TauE/SafE family protein [Leptospira kobayashii]BDA78657.1 membrane protein [Leptospira kobayashii]